MRQNIAGYPFESYTPAEATADFAAFGHQIDRLIREQSRGIKALKLPQVVAQASGTTLNLGATGGAESVACGPESGYFWRVQRVLIASSGTDTGAVSLYAGSDPTAFDAAHLIDTNLKVNTAYYPGNRGLFLWPGEQLYAAVTSVANSTYRITGAAVEVPAEMQGKILGN